MLVAAFYWLCVSILRVIFLLFSRRQVIGRQNLPRQGPLIIVSNHLNNADPGFLAVALPRRIVFMAKHEIFDWPLLGQMFRWAGVFPVHRFEADLAALRRAGRVLKEGQALGMFPEGTRSRNGGLGPAYPGTALIALRSGAPIVPVAITGTEQVTGLRALLRRPALRMVIGEPFFLPGGKRIRTAEVLEGTEIIMRRIAELLPPQYRGVYGDGLAATAPRRVASSSMRGVHADPFGQG